MSETIMFKGITFRRYPDSENWADRVYYTPGHADRANGARRLHEEIWIQANGPIPDGHHIHHADLNPLNNALSNLVLMTAFAHKSLHASRPPSAARLAHLERIRPLSKGWHASPEGRAWHSSHALLIAATRSPSKAICEFCFGDFESLQPRRFCSNKCRSASRRADGLDNEARQCSGCGAYFSVNKYSKVKNCSRSCSQKGVPKVRKR